MTQIALEKDFELAIIKELNSSKVSAEEHSSNTVKNLEGILEIITNNENLKQIKNLVFLALDEIQYQDLNRQKIERVMNLLIEKHNISEDILRDANIKLSPSAHHIDHEDGDCLSDYELEKIIEESNKKS